MPHHFTKGTVSAVFWCDVCYRDTEHRVDDGRRGPCLNPSGRVVWEHTASVRRTSANDCTSVPSPKASVAGPDYAIAGREDSGGISLATAAALSSQLATANAGDAESGKATIASVATPRSEDSECTGAHRGTPDTLHSQTKAGECADSNERGSQIRRAEGDAGLGGRYSCGENAEGIGPASTQSGGGVVRGDNPLGPGLEGHFGDVREWRGPGWLDPLTARSVAEAGATRGFWADCDWWWGRDEKYRPAGPKVQPLAHGYSGRVGLLRLAGDAIVVPLAQAFIESVMEVIA